MVVGGQFLLQNVTTVLRLGICHHMDVDVPVRVSVAELPAAGMLLVLYIGLYAAGTRSSY
jgi:hypothetical protein